MRRLDDRGQALARCAMDAPDAQNWQQGRKSRRRESKTTRRRGQSSQRSPMSGCQRKRVLVAGATSWTSRDGASKLFDRKVALIERTADSTSVIYYTVSDEKTDAAAPERNP